MAERVLCFGSAATAVQFFALEKEGEKKKKDQDNKPAPKIQKREERKEEPKARKERKEEPRARKLNVFERLGKIPEPKPHNNQRKRTRNTGNVAVPQWHNYALLGDSIMVRVAKALQVPLQNSPACRGGLTLVALRNIFRKMETTPTNVIVLAGVNDVLQGVSRDAIIQFFYEIMTMLRVRGTKKAILLQLLPIINLRSLQMQKKIIEINQCISQMDGGLVTVLEVYSLFMSNSKKGEEPNSTLFERKKGANGMVVHPGFAGVNLIISTLKTLLFIQ